MLMVVPKLGGQHRRLLEARLDSIERLVADAQHVTGIEVVIVVEQQLDHVAVGVVAGDDAVVATFDAAPWASWFLRARPWVPVLIIDSTNEPQVAFGRLAARTGRLS